MTLGMRRASATGLVIASLQELLRWQVRGRPELRHSLGADDVARKSDRRHAFADRSSNTQSLSPVVDTGAITARYLRITVFRAAPHRGRGDPDHHSERLCRPRKRRRVQGLRVQHAAVNPGGGAGDNVRPIHGRVIFGRETAKRAARAQSARSTQCASIVKRRVAAHSRSGGTRRFQPYLNGD